MIEQKSITIKNVKKPPTTPTVYWKNFLPKKVTIAPKTIIKIAITHGLLLRKTAHEVAEKTGHPLT